MLSNGAVSALVRQRQLRSARDAEAVDGEDDVVEIQYPAHLGDVAKSLREREVLDETTDHGYEELA